MGRKPNQTAAPSTGTHMTVTQASNRSARARVWSMRSHAIDQSTRDGLEIAHFHHLPLIHHSSFIVHRTVDQTPSITAEHLHRSFPLPLFHSVPHPHLPSPLLSAALAPTALLSVSTPSHGFFFRRRFRPRTSTPPQTRDDWVPTPLEAPTIPIATRRLQATSPDSSKLHRRDRSHAATDTFSQARLT